MKFENDILKLTFNNEKENEFYFAMSEVLIKLMNQKFNNFLEYCIFTHNAKPLKQIMDILSINNN